MELNNVDFRYLLNQWIIKKNLKRKTGKNAKVYLGLRQMGKNRVGGKDHPPKTKEKDFFTALCESL